MQSYVEQLPDNVRTAAFLDSFICKAVDSWFAHIIIKTSLFTHFYNKNGKNIYL